MWLNGAALLLGLVVVVLAVYRDARIEDPRPAGPDWGLLPMPSDVARIDFPLALPGYDPASVETHLEALRRAYEDVVAVAPPEVLARARRRAADRAGVRAEDDPPAPARTPWVRETPAGVSGDRDALRLEAALSRVDDPPEGDAGPL